MATEISSFDSNHTDLIHDAKFDYYGRRLATCSSDTTIKIFEVLGETQKEISVLKGHGGPVWSVDWSHPKFGCFLASCGYDHKIIIWHEHTNGKWNNVFSYTCKSSVNCVCWGPPECGLTLACASSDCSIIVISYDSQQQKWIQEVLNNAHQIGCTSVSWASATPVGSITKQEEGKKKSISVKRFVSGGCDNKAIIWKKPEHSTTWIKEKEFEAHSDWVRDVAWCPNVGLPCDTIATCGQDKCVYIWTKKVNSEKGEQQKEEEEQEQEQEQKDEESEEEEQEWKKTEIKMNNVVWKVSWSTGGNMLAITTADNEVKLYKENLSDGNWEEMGEIKE